MVDQVPGSRREPGRLGGGDPLDPGSLEVCEEVIQVKVGRDEFKDLLEGGQLSESSINERISVSAGACSDTRDP